MILDKKAPTKTEDGYVKYLVGNEEVTEVVKLGEATFDGKVKAVSGLVYSGKAQELVSAKEAVTGGKILYRLGAEGTWQETVPAAANAGDYAVYYYVKGDEDHRDKGSEKEPLGPVTVTIAAKAVVVTPDGAQSKICGEKDPVFTYKAEGLIGKDTLSGALAREAGETPGEYAYKIGTLGSENKNYKVSLAENAGKFIIKDAPKEVSKETLSLNAKLKVTQTGSKINVKWGKVKGADSYKVYVEYCGKSKSKTEKTTKKTSVTLSKIKGKNLNLKKEFKVYVVAYKKVKGKKTEIARSLDAHVAGRLNKKNTNAKSISLQQPKVTMTVGDTHVIKAKTKRQSKKKKLLDDSHEKEFRYASTDVKVAGVSEDGTVTAYGKGTCTIYVYARNGLAKKVSVTVQ
ncbi:MAG: Ig-like domain-containing protein, partial [Lachnospiraceae bacterium]|nr:Ig-like domain-containing protein [Lachnospiraceae bacterium]